MRGIDAMKTTNQAPNSYIAIMLSHIYTLTTSPAGPVRSVIHAAAAAGSHRRDASNAPACHPGGGTPLLILSPAPMPSCPQKSTSDAPSGIIKLATTRSLSAVLQAMSESYVGRWTLDSDRSSPSDFSSLSTLARYEGTPSGVPVCYPSMVTDKSGRLEGAISTGMLREMQRPLMNVVPSDRSSMLACMCETCDPQAGFPPGTFS